MSTHRACDVCGFYRQNLDGSSAVFRYGLSRQVPVPGSNRAGRPESVAFKRERHYGGIDLCNECWTKIAGPKTRPKTRSVRRSSIPHPVDSLE